MQTWNLYTVSFDGCAVGVKSSKGKPIKKPWRINTSSPKFCQSFQDKRCKHRRGEHDAASGKETRSTQSYPIKMCHMMIQSLFPDEKLAPKMQTRPVTKHKHRPMTRAACVCPSPFMLSEYERIKPFSKKKPVERKLPQRAEVAYSSARPNQDGTKKQQKRKDRYIRKLRKKSRLWVTKALNKKESDNSPECQRAIRAEGDALAQCGTSDEESVSERDKLIQ